MWESGGIFPALDKETVQIFLIKFPVKKET
jgi:hypothetical protein